MDIRCAFFLLSSLCMAAASGQEVISKVKIISSLLGKDRFVHHYLLSPGDYFDQVQHTRSIELIRQELINDGYLKALVKDALSHDEATKTVLVSLYLEPGRRYQISKIIIRPTGKPIDEQILHDIYALLEPLSGIYAEQKVLNEYGKKLHTLLVRKGFVKPSLDLTQVSDDENAQVTLTYNIRLDERHEFTFVGNQFFSTSELLDDLFSVIEQGIVLPPALIAQDIIDLYKKKGFVQARVSWDEDDTRVIFRIAEGDRYAVGAVTVLEEFTDRKSLGVINALQDVLAKIPAYDEEQIDQLVRKAVIGLADLGYWNIVFSKEAIVQKTSKIDLVITLTQAGVEGSPQPLMAKHVSIKGFDDLAMQGPFAEWNMLSTPRPVKPSDIDKQHRWLLHTMNNQGYQSAHISYVVDKDLTLLWTIDAAGPLRFGSVQILGLQKMKPFIITRELCFQEGDIWDKRKIDESIKRLQSLQMFESITFHPEQTIEGTQGVPVLVKPLLIKVCEDDPYEIRTRIGLQVVSKSFTNISWTTWKLGGSFIFKNPTGYADRLILDADWTRYTLNLAASYELPWLGPWPVRTLAKIYSDRFDQPLLSDRNKRLYKEAHDGCSITFLYQHPWWTSCVRTGFEVNQLSGICHHLAQVIQFEPRLVDQQIPYFYCEPSVTFEYCDNKVDPSRGVFSTLSLKAMVPPTISEGWFIRALIEQSLFYPLYGSVIGALRWRIGHIFNAKFNTILPTERFYLGGANSLRGYETNMVPPLNDLTSDGRCIFVPIGGKSMVNINAELRFPLYKQLNGVIFTDMGILVQDRFADIAANKWLGATGFGLRLTSPIGPIRFDIGWKWKKRDPRDTSYAAFLTLGHAF